MTLQHPSNTLVLFIMLATVAVGIFGRGVRTSAVINFCLKTYDNITFSASSSMSSLIGRLFPQASDWISKWLSIFANASLAYIFGTIAWNEYFRHPITNWILEKSGRLFYFIAHGVVGLLDFIGRIFGH
jgi:hypothetical protein